MAKIYESLSPILTTKEYQVKFKQLFLVIGNTKSSINSLF